MDRKIISTIATRVWPYFFLLFVWVIFGYSFFFQGNVPFPSKYQVTHFHPWSIYNIYSGSVKNESLPDVVGELYPWRAFSIGELKKGQLPVWNPNNFSGNPHIANYQSAAFSPFTFLFLIFPFLFAWSILILIQPLFAGIFTYLLLREYAVSKIGSLISSVTFMFCGFMVVWMAYGTLGMAIAFLPLALFVIEKFYKTHRWFWLIFLSVSIIFSFFSGHFQTSLYVFLFICCFIFYKILTTKKKKDGVFVILFLCIGLLVASIQIIPTIFFYLQSARSGDFLTTTQNESGIPFYYLVTLFVPDFFGSPITRNSWSGSYIEWASFVGIIPVLLAFFTFFARKKSIVLFFIIMTLTSLLFAIKSPLQEILFSMHIPVLSTSYPTRIIVLFSFSWSVLAGFGLDVLKELFITQKQKKIVYIFSVVFVIFLVIWGIVLFSHFLSADQMAITKRNLLIPTGLFIGASSIVALITLLRNKRIIHYLLFLLVLLVVFDSLRFAQKWVPFEPKNYVFPDIAIVEKMQTLRGEGRIYGHLGNEVYTYYRLPAIEGYDPLFLKRYAEFIASSEHGTLQKTNRYEVLLPRRGAYTNRVLDTLGVSLIYHPVADTFQNWAYPVWENGKRNQLVFQDNKVQLYKNTQALPRTMMFYDYDVITKDDKIIKRFYSNSFDFRKKLILEEDPKLNKIKNASGSAHIIQYDPNKVVITVDTNQSGLLFLSDNYYPNWHVVVDGKKEKIYRADYTLRAVKVPKGKSNVVFYYNYF